MFMSISGCVLVLFLTFHMCMNLALVISNDAYNAICGFLGANWYAVAATVLLALVVVLHFALAIVLTIQNDRISFSQNGIEVCYISNAKMGIREVEITERAAIVGINVYKTGNIIYIN